MTIHVVARAELLVPEFPAIYDFKVGQRVSFTVPEWGSAETVYIGKIVQMFLAERAAVRTDNGNKYSVPLEALTLIGGGDENL